ncbi:Asi2p [Lachancea thermotolerans CBS 6340]|uniref:KLTH0B06028p n=1 Tax=Lachancea thermotolerans (strain ATCC 56472 / CBS 6340 / NRRL Y-8284) TaxID=559295 RepID=C5DCV1_LACTC|nr:KLTH0B06028p [Lachancea thermotolerans CBS 6340]CAR21612.1 KLTH0B06028p [Lachancea thermotolerans CBS 6340]
MTFFMLQKDNANCFKDLDQVLQIKTKSKVKTSCESKKECQGQPIEEKMSEDLMHSLQNQNRQQRRAAAMRANPPFRVRVGPRHRQENPFRWPPGVQRRQYLRLFLQNLLILDHLLMMVLFPFSVYNVLKILLTEVTFSNSDFVTDIASYCKFSSILSEDGRSVILFKSGFGLLGKFHNIIVYYSAPLFAWLSSNSSVSSFVMRTYTLVVKFTAVVLYTLYGVSASTYVCFATFFFSLCLLMTCFRRYKGVAKIVGQLYRTTSGIF